MFTIICLLLSIIFGLLYSFFHTISGSTASVTVEILWFLFLFSSGATLAQFLSYVLIEIFFSKIRGHTSSDLLRFIISFFLYAGIITLMFKYALGWNLTAILTTSALITAVIGFALQATLGNLFSGVALQIEQSFYIGDVIKIGNRQGRIETLKWRSISILTFDGTLLVIPNNQISTETVEVYPLNKPVRITVIIPAPLSVSPEKVKMLIHKVVLATPDVETTIKPFIRIHDYETERGIIKYQLRYFVVNYFKKHIVDGIVKDRIWYAFYRNKIKLPVIPWFKQELPDEENTQLKIMPYPDIPKEIILKCLSSITKNPENTPDNLDQLLQIVNTYIYASGEPILYTENRQNAYYYIYKGYVKIKQNKDNDIEHLNINQKLDNDIINYWPEDILTKVFQELLMFMGPISEKLVTHAANSTLDTRQLYLTLANHIANENDKKQFLSFAPDYSYKILLKESWFHTKDVSINEAYAQGETILLEVPDEK